MRTDGAGCAAPIIRRRADGSIDCDFYAARARDLRAAEIRRLLRALVAWLRRR